MSSSAGFGGIGAARGSGGGGRPSFRVISIGAMAAHPLWGEKGEVRAAHATTTLIDAGSLRILVDPSLPAKFLVPRLHERAGIDPAAITHVFLTSFHPMRRRGLDAFAHADWVIAEMEREMVGADLVSRFHEAHGAGDAEVARLLKEEIDRLERCRAAPDHLTPGVDLFPLPGVTPGSAGLLLALPRLTVLVAGDAVATEEHLGAGQVITPCFDIDQAKSSLTEAAEIAEVIVCGRDNAVLNAARQPASPFAIVAPRDA